MKLKFEILLQYNLKFAAISSAKMVLLHAKEGKCSMQSWFSAADIEHFFDVKAAFRDIHRTFEGAGRRVLQNLFDEKGVFRLLSRKTC